MNAPIRFAALALVTLGIVACKKDPPPAPPPAAQAPAEASPSAAPSAEPASAPATAEAAASTVAIAAANLGTAVGTDKRVTAPAESFSKGDTIHLSVETTGTGPATIHAKWIFKEKDGSHTTVSEGSQTIDATGPGAISFGLNNASGWPVGDYQIEIRLNDTLAQTKLFTVK